MDVLSGIASLAPRQAPERAEAAPPPDGAPFAACLDAALGRADRRGDGAPDGGDVAGAMDDDTEAGAAAAAANAADTGPAGDAVDDAAAADATGGDGEADADDGDGPAEAGTSGAAAVAPLPDVTVGDGEASVPAADAAIVADDAAAGVAAAPDARTAATAGDETHAAQPVRNAPSPATQADAAKGAGIESEGARPVTPPPEIAPENVARGGVVDAAPATGESTEDDAPAAASTTRDVPSPAAGADARMRTAAKAPSDATAALGMARAGEAEKTGAFAATGASGAMEPEGAMEAVGAKAAVRHGDGTEAPAPASKTERIELPQALRRAVAAGDAAGRPAGGDGEAAPAARREAQPERAGAPATARYETTRAQMTSAEAATVRSDGAKPLPPTAGLTAAPGAGARPAHEAAPATAARMAPQTRPLAAAELPERALLIAEELRGDGESVWRATLELDPPELGRLRVEMRLEDGRVFTRFTVESAAAHERVSAQADRLRDALAGQGMEDGGVEVLLDQSGLGDAREGETGAERQDPAARADEAEPDAAATRRSSAAAGRLDTWA